MQTATIATVGLLVVAGITLAAAKSVQFPGKRSSRDDFIRCNCDTNHEPVCDDLGDVFHNQCIAECEGVFTFTQADINGECEPVEEEKRAGRRPMLSWSTADKNAPPAANGRRPQMKVNNSLQP